MTLCLTQNSAMWSVQVRKQEVDPASSRVAIRSGKSTTCYKQHNWYITCLITTLANVVWIQPLPEKMSAAHSFQSG